MDIFRLRQAIESVEFLPDHKGLSIVVEAAKTQLKTMEREYLDRLNRTSESNDCSSKSSELSEEKHDILRKDKPLENLEDKVDLYPWLYYMF